MVVGLSATGAVALLLPEAANAAADPTGTIYVADYGANQIDVFAPGANGNVAPIRTIVGSNTGLGGPADVAVDAAGDLYSSNYNIGTITEYAPGAAGNATPINTISGANTGLSNNDDISLAPDGTLYVGSNANGTVLVFAPGATGNATPIRTISGSNTTLGSDVDGVGVDAIGNLFAANTTAAAIDEFAPGANGNVAPTAVISGSNTGLTFPDDVKVGFSGQLFVSDGNNSLEVFSAGASGNATPTRSISGSNTGLVNIDDLAVDPAGAMYVADYGGGAVDVFGASQTGNVAPQAKISGALTTLINPEGVALAEPVSSITLSTTAASSSVSLGGSTSDKATLSGGTNPKGSIIFKLFGPNDSTCSAAPAYTSPVQSVTGNGTYTSPGFVPATVGTYYWVAAYSGDTNNPPLTEPCATPSETVTVGGAQSDPAITNVHGTSITEAERRTAQVTVASFTDPDPTTIDNDYTASINWGDGTTTTGAVRENARAHGFIVVGHHGYTVKGVFTVTVTITDSDGPTEPTATTKITVK